MLTLSKKLSSECLRTACKRFMQSIAKQTKTMYTHLATLNTKCHELLLITTSKVVESVLLSTDKVDDDDDDDGTQA